MKKISLFATVLLSLGLACSDVTLAALCQPEVQSIEKREHDLRENNKSIFLNLITELSRIGKDFDCVRMNEDGDDALVDKHMEQIRTKTADCFEKLRKWISEKNFNEAKERESRKISTFLLVWDNFARTGELEEFPKNIISSFLINSVCLISFNEYAPLFGLTEEDIPAEIKQFFKDSAIRNMYEKLTQKMNVILTASNDTQKPFGNSTKEAVALFLQGQKIALENIEKQLCEELAELLEDESLNESEILAELTFAVGDISRENDNSFPQGLDVDACTALISNTNEQEVIKKYPHIQWDVMPTPAEFVERIKIGFRETMVKLDEAFKTQFGEK